jgi:uncharacterized protein
MDEKQKEEYKIGWLNRKLKKEKKHKYMSKDAMEKAKKISRLLKNKYNINEVILFGSLAEDKFRENSDIDIAIPNYDGKEYMKIVKDVIYIASPYKVDLLPLEKASNSLKRKIAERGVIL